MTLNEIIEKRMKIAGDLKVTLHSWQPTQFFRPYFQDKGGDWNGVDHDGIACEFFGELEGWHSFIEPGKKVKLYKWAWQDKSTKKWIETNYFFPAEFEFGKDETYMRLDYSMIEVEEG